jgi:Na+/H+-dicarboxylate symporter
MDTLRHSSSKGRQLPLYLRVALGGAIGIVLGYWLGPEPHALGLGAQTLAEAGMLVVRILKLLATPLIFFCVLDAVLTAEIPTRKAWTLVGISAVNALVAVLIALGCARCLDSGRGKFAGLREYATHADAGSMASAVGGSLAPQAVRPSLSALLPENLVDPFRQNNVIAVVLLGVLIALALRAVQKRGTPQAAHVEIVAAISRAALQAWLVLLGWVIRLIPLAVAGVLAGAVARTGMTAIRSLGAFLATMLLGLLLHAVVYYGLLIASVGRRSPLAFFRGMADALMTALSSGSSIATLPVTLGCLERLGVRKTSARLAGCIGTNLNHDGIILYEAAATLFVAQALGMHLSLAEQLRVAGAAVLAGIGMAGVPEAGLITLPLVMVAGGIPPQIAAAVLPLVLPVDWIIGRFRAATNVTSDATVAVLLDRLAPVSGPEDAAAVGLEADAELPLLLARPLAPAFNPHLERGAPEQP